MTPFDAPVMTPEEFVAQLAEDGFGLSDNPDAMSYEELRGSWEWYHQVIEDARLVTLHASPAEGCEMLAFTRALAQRTCLPAERLTEPPHEHHVLVETMRGLREIERQANDLVRENGPAPRF